MIKVIQKIFLTCPFFIPFFSFFLLVAYSLSSIGGIRRNTGKRGGGVNRPFSLIRLGTSTASSPWVGLKPLSIRSTLQSAGREVYIVSFQVTKTDWCFSLPKRAMKTSLVQGAAHLVFRLLLKHNLREYFCLATDNETRINKFIPPTSYAVVLDRYLAARIWRIPPHITRVFLFYAGSPRIKGP